MAALNLRPHSHQYIDVQAWGSYLQATRLDQVGLDIILPAHYQQRFISRFTTFRKMLSTEMTMCAEISQYDDTIYGVALYPQRLYKLII